jgi:hypothetical protein
VRAEVDAPCQGLILVPDNVFPKPQNEAELSEEAPEFVDLSNFQPAEPYQTPGFLFRPAS